MSKMRCIRPTKKYPLYPRELGVRKKMEAKFGILGDPLGWCFQRGSAIHRRKVILMASTSK